MGTSAAGAVAAGAGLAAAFGGSAAAVLLLVGWTISLFVIGLVLLAIAVVTGMNGLVHLHTPSAYAYVLITVSVLSASVFIWRQRHAEHPLMEFKLFDIRAFRMGACVNMREGGMWRGPLSRRAGGAWEGGGTEG